METVCSFWSIYHCPFELDACQQEKLNRLWVTLLQANKLLNAPNWKLFMNNQKIFWLSWHSTFLVAVSFFPEGFFNTLMETAYVLRYYTDVFQGVVKWN